MMIDDPEDEALSEGRPRIDVWRSLEASNHTMDKVTM